MNKIITCDKCQYLSYQHICNDRDRFVRDPVESACTFGKKRMTNEEKFEEIFGITFHWFVADLKREDQFQWGKTEYQEDPCENL